jgi:hypothetical protein
LQTDFLWYSGENFTLKKEFKNAYNAYAHTLDLARESYSQEREINALVRLACIEKSMILAEKAFNLADSPITRATKYAVQGEFLQARVQILEHQDQFEIALFLLENSRIFNVEEYYYEGSSILSSLS